MTRPETCWTAQPAPWGYLKSEQKELDLEERKIALGTVQYVQEVMVSFVEEENRLKTEEEGIVFGPCSRLEERNWVEMPSLARRPLAQRRMGRFPELIGFGVERVT